MKSKARVQKEKSTEEPHKRSRKRLWVVVILFHIGGLIASVHAVETVRTPQGAVAWAVSLNTFPYAALPAYLVFGRSRFEGYVAARRDSTEETRYLVESVADDVREFLLPEQEMIANLRALEGLAKLPFTKRNNVELLIDGEAAFASMFQAIEEAEDYILVQFYIVRDDEIGTDLAQRLAKKSREGVDVYFLYDEIGSLKLSDAYTQDLKAAGVEVSKFNSRKGIRNRFQLNFRNHRKIIVADGRVGFVGGFNVGDEYLGKDEDVGPWRDTHSRLTGPCVLALQLAFVEDWRWATGKLPDIEWVPVPAEENDMAVLVLPSGPADEIETAELAFIHAINSAEERVWIATPYFVPEHGVVSALRLARLRGVEVKVLLPDESDGFLVDRAAWSHFRELEGSGVQFYRWGPGFLHEKVLLVDRTAAVVGTANFDNRSFRLNFEIAACVIDEGFADKVASMLETDFANAREMTIAELEDKGSFFDLTVKFSRLMSPIL